MRGLRKILLEERKRLERIIKVVQVQLETMPEGSLRLSKNKKYIQYYHCTAENKLGKYIVKENDELIQALAQKSYDEIDEVFRTEHIERQHYQPISCILRAFVVS